MAALGGQYGGMVVMNPRTGALLALAGIAYSALQPPGSTMKIITATGALQAHVATLSTVFSDRHLGRHRGLHPAERQR